MLHKQLMIAVLSLGALTAAPAGAYAARNTTKYSGSWATHTSVNLYRCSPSIIRSKSEIERFMRNLCNYLGLTRNNATQFLYHYAGNGYTSGLSAFQQANGHTDIAIRVDELNNDIYMDFFSCAPYDAYEIARRAQDYFIAFDMTHESIYR